MASTNRATILSYRGDGLGARLCSILNTIALSRASGVDFKIAWLPIDGKDMDATKIFSPRFIASHILNQNLTADQLVFDPSVFTSKTAEQFASTALDDHYYCVTEAFQRLKFKDQIEDISNADLMSALDWHEEFHRIFTEIEARGIGDYRSLHIRRGDLLTEPYSHMLYEEKYVPEIIFEEFIRSEAARGDGRFLIFSDNPEVGFRLRSKFPTCLVPTDFLNFTYFSPLQRDLIELVMMAKTREIIAPVSSAFSATASFLGGKRHIAIQSLFSDEQTIGLLSRGLLISDSYGNGQSERMKDTILLALLLHKTSRTHDAVKLMDKNLPLGIDNISYLTKFVTFLDASGRHAEAIGYASKLIELAEVKHSHFEILHPFAVREEARFVYGFSILHALMYDAELSQRKDTSYLLTTRAISLMKLATDNYPNASHFRDVRDRLLKLHNDSVELSVGEVVD